MRLVAPRRDRWASRRLLVAFALIAGPCVGCGGARKGPVRAEPTQEKALPTDDDALDPEVAGVPLVPRALLFADRDRASIQLGPDGAHVGWLDVTSPAAPILIRSIDSPGGEDLTLPGPVAAWQWLFPGDAVLAVVPAEAGAQLDRVSLQGERRTLLRAASIRITALGPDAPEQAIVDVRGAKGVPDGFARLDLSSGRLEPIRELEGYALPFFDGRLRLAAALRHAPERTVLDRRTPQGTWRPFMTIEAVDTVAPGIVAVSRDGAHITFTTNDDSDTTRLEEIDTATGARRVLITDPEADILHVGGTVDPASGRVASVVSYHVRLRRHILDPSMRGHFDTLQSSAHAADVSVAGQSLDDTRWLVRFLDGGPARYAIYDLPSRRVTPLFREVPGLEDARWASRHAIALPARDGLPLRADVLLPPGSDPDGDGVPERPLPAILVVHGGPWVGFEWNIWEVNRHLQLLANRGYAVLRASFRGEPGYGKKFVDAGDRQWAGAMMNDLEDIVADATARGIADPEQVGVLGWSFGGTATATLLARRPTPFRCGIALYGVYDLPAFLETPFAQNDFWRARVGDLADAADRRRLAAESPIAKVGSLEVPLLLAHGTRDDRVPLAQSEALASALAELKRPATFLVFPGAGHDLGDPRAWQAFWAVGERFLAEHLGGRFEASHGELAVAGVEVRSGAAYVPGLAGPGSD
jgi:dienelactone hydrolase